MSVSEGFTEFLALFLVPGLKRVCHTAAGFHADISEVKFLKSLKFHILSGVNL